MSEELINENQQKRDRDWSMLANQVVGGEIIAPTIPTDAQRIAALEAWLSEMSSKINSLNWELSGHVDAGGGIAALEGWINAKEDRIAALEKRCAQLDAALETERELRQVAEGYLEQFKTFVSGCEPPVYALHIRGQATTALASLLKPTCELLREIQTCTVPGSDRLEKEIQRLEGICKP